MFPFPVQIRVTAPHSRHSRGWHQKVDGAHRRSRQHTGLAYGKNALHTFTHLYIETFHSYFLSCLETFQTNERKESMMFALRDALAVGSIHLSNEFFCLSQGVVQMKQQLEDELRNYCVLVEPSKTPFGKSTCRESNPFAHANVSQTIMFMFVCCVLSQKNLYR